MPRFSQLSDWLAWLETLHPNAIDLGLERIYLVAQSLGLLQAPTCRSHAHSGALAIANLTLFTVAGTNGKGSCVTTIERCLSIQSHKVGTYTSPHLHSYAERIRINGQPVKDKVICDAFAAIDQARGDISLTYFEFGTLAALWIFVQQQIPFVVLEVGLGGRLDAVNIVDADIAVVTSIDVDHEEWLGSDRETIALEKLGVVRDSIPVIIAEDDLTQSLRDFMGKTPLAQAIHHHFWIKSSSSKECRWTPSEGEPEVVLPMPSLALNSVIAGLQALHNTDYLPDPSDIATVLQDLQLAGRFQVERVSGTQVIFDVAHNPAAAAVLAKKLSASDVEGQATRAVFAVMADKDIESILHFLKGNIDAWYLGALAMNHRSERPESVSQRLNALGQNVYSHEVIEGAFDLALSHSTEHDRIVVFGSFFSVEAIQLHCHLV